MSKTPYPLSVALDATLLALCLALPSFAASALLATPWNVSRQGGFVIALAEDRQGHFWAATKGNGVWRCDPTALPGHQWTQFTAENTHGALGDDDIYSLTCDRLGRIWAGTGRDGVSVFNGKAWKTYDRLTGPLGCHVVAQYVHYFKPTMYNFVSVTDAIYVPLRVQVWNWFGDAAYNNNTWSHGETPEYPASSSDADAQSFPVWTTTALPVTFQ